MAVVASAAAAEEQRKRQMAAAAEPFALGQDLMPTDGLAVVRLRRRVYGGGAAMPWPVFVDGEAAGLLRLGERLQFFVHPGSHLLEVRPTLWNVRANSVGVVAEAGEIIEMVCQIQPGFRFRPFVVFERQGPGRVVGNRPPPPSG